MAGHPLRRRSHRRPAVARPCRRPRSDGGGRRDGLRSGLPSARQPGRAARRRRRAGRGLPGAERLVAGGRGRGTGAPGDGVDPRRCVHVRLVEPAAVRRHLARRPRRRRGRDDQLPAGRVRLPRPGGTAARQRLRPQPRAQGRAARPALGAGQHRRLRRRPRTRDGLRRVRGRRPRHHAAGDAVGRRPVPAGDRAVVARIEHVRRRPRTRCRRTVRPRARNRPGRRRLHRDRTPRRLRRRGRPRRHGRLRGSAGRSPRHPRLRAGRRRRPAPCAAWPSRS